MAYQTLHPSWNPPYSGSQEERIGLLNMALAQKGVSTNGHYDLSPPALGPHRAGPEVVQSTSAERAFTTHNLEEDDFQQPQHRVQEDENGGIHL
jgi:hypothetical protein